MPLGLLVPGTIDPFVRPRVDNPDGTYSTLRTITVEDNGRVVLLPMVVGGKVVSPQEAVDHYRRTGEHLGIFSDERSAEAYDKRLHDQIEPGSYERGGRHMATPMTDPKDTGFAAQPIPAPDMTDPYAAPENPGLPGTGTQIPGSLYGMSPDEFRRRVALYRMNRFGTGLPPGTQGGLQASGTGISPEDVLGQGMVQRMKGQGMDRWAAAPSSEPGYGAAAPEAPPPDLGMEFPQGSPWTSGAQPPQAMAPSPFPPGTIGPGNPLQPPHNRQRLVAQMLRRPYEAQGG